MSGKDAINIGDLTPQQRLDVARCEKVSGEEVEVVQYQCREIGETGWEDCGSEGYNYCNRSALHDTRTLMTVAQHHRITEALLEDARYNYQLALDWQDKVIALQAQLSQQQVPGWKLVPVEPTPEMVSAAEEAHMPFGDMDIALRMAILSAPSAPATVQGVNAQLLEALKEIAWSNDSTWQSDKAEAAIAAARQEGGKV